MNKLIISTVIGGGLGVFDFLIFVFLSPLLTNIFFPSANHNLALIFIYLTISFSYLLRPFGGALIGYINYKYGRKAVFNLTIFLMAVPSLIIELLPTYNQIGILAPFILICARLVQGLSLGAEIPSTATYIIEKYHNKNYFLYAAGLTFGANLGVVFGSELIHLLTKYTTSNFMNTFGWRIPFIIASILGLFAFYIRRSITKDTNIQQMKAEFNKSHVSITNLFKQYKSQVILGISLALVISLFTSIFHVFLPNLLVNYYGFNLTQASNFSSLGAITLAISSLGIAALTKYISPVKMMNWSIISLFIVMLVLCTLDIELSKYNIRYFYLMVFIISLLLSGVNGVLFGVLAKLFPSDARYSGVATSFNLAYVLGAGITPIWTSIVLQTTGNYKYIIAICLVVLVCSLFLINQANRKNKFVTF
jgi:MFS family permease